MFTNTMTANKLSVLKRQAAIAKKHKYFLAGGSALALHLGHRTSRDLDWFSDSNTDEQLLMQDLSRDNYRPHRISAQTIHAVCDRIEASFIAKPGIGSAFQNVSIDGTEVPIASIEQIAAMKVLALCNRGFRRDFIDIYAIAKSGRMTMEHMLASCRRFGVPDHQINLALKYFGDADDQPHPMGCRYSWAQVKAFFTDL